MSETGEMAGALHSAMSQDDPESLAQRCRRQMDDPKIPPELRNTLFEAAKALDWQELVLTGLSQQEKDVVGALSHTIACQQEEIRKLENREHDRNMQQQMDRMKQQQEMQQRMTKYAGQATAGTVTGRAYSEGLLPTTLGPTHWPDIKGGAIDNKAIDALIQEALKFKG